MITKLRALAEQSALAWQERVDSARRLAMREDRVAAGHELFDKAVAKVVATWRDVAAEMWSEACIEIEVGPVDYAACLDRLEEARSLAAKWSEGSLERQAIELVTAERDRLAAEREAEAAVERYRDSILSDLCAVRADADDSDDSDD